MTEKSIKKQVGQDSPENNKDTSKIAEHLSNISTKLKNLTDKDEKIQILVELNDYLKIYGDLIEKTCPEKLVSILNSL